MFGVFNKPASQAEPPAVTQAEPPSATQAEPPVPVTQSVPSQSMFSKFFTPAPKPYVPFVELIPFPAELNAPQIYNYKKQSIPCVCTAKIVDFYYIPKEHLYNIGTDIRNNFKEIKISYRGTPLTYAKRLRPSEKVDNTNPINNFRIAFDIDYEETIKEEGFPDKINKGCLEYITEDMLKNFPMLYASFYDPYFQKRCIRKGGKKMKSKKGRRSKKYGFQRTRRQAS